MTKTRRTGFDSTLNLDEVVVEVGDCRYLTSDALRDIAARFNRLGMVILDHDDFDEPRDQLLALREFFGSVYHHDRADDDGVVLITQLPGLSEYLGASNAEHPLHTDSAYEDAPSRILCLQCVVPAQGGGMSVAASAKSLLDWVKATEPTLLRELFAEDLLENINSTPIGQLLKTIASLPEVRQEKILNVRHQLSQGKYDLNERLDTALDKVLEELIV